ncbi:hypothetical protein QCA50_013102 [Cerrena zonata]|uniref:Uncharacterized protein n=1 Tax=Cerrena zonata TaxID=2478898 RepID=A0AAW0FSA7_9APHY
MPQKRDLKAGKTLFPNASPDVQAGMDKLVNDYKPRSNSGDPSTIVRHVASQISENPEVLQHLLAGMNSV